MSTVILRFMIKRADKQIHPVTYEKYKDTQNGNRGVYLTICFLFFCAFPHIPGTYFKILRLYTYKRIKKK